MSIPILEMGSRVLLRERRKASPFHPGELVGELVRGGHILLWGNAEPGGTDKDDDDDDDEGGIVGFSITFFCSLAVGLNLDSPCPSRAGVAILDRRSRS